MIVQYKCPNCGDDMHFDSISGKLKCDSCDTLMDIEKMPDPDVPDESGSEDESPKVSPYDAAHIADEAVYEQIREENGTGIYGEGSIQYICKNCGAALVTAAETTATNCSFCGAPMVLENRLSGELAPTRIIPFTIDKQQAEEGFRKWCRHGLLTPRDFMTANRIKSITGMYVPFWLFDMGGTVEADATATKTRTYSRGDYIYHETKYFHVYRRLDVGYLGIPADASEKMNDTLMDKLEPFHYNQLTSFKMPYLAGYLAEKYDYTDEQLLPRVQKRADEYADDFLKSTVSGYSSVTYNRKDIRLRKINAHYTLLPVWMVCYDYRDSEHVFAMNGQTGKVVGKPPLSKGKIWAWFGGVSAAAFAVMQLITMIVR